MFKYSKFVPAVALLLSSTVTFSADEGGGGEDAGKGKEMIVRPGGGALATKHNAFMEMLAKKRQARNQALGLWKNQFAEEHGKFLKALNEAQAGAQGEVSAQLDELQKHANLLHEDLIKIRKKAEEGALDSYKRDIAFREWLENSKQLLNKAKDQGKDLYAAIVDAIKAEMKAYKEAMDTARSEEDEMIKNVIKEIEEMNAANQNQ